MLVRQADPMCVDVVVHKTKSNLNLDLLHLHTRAMRAINIRNIAALPFGLSHDIVKHIEVSFASDAYCFPIPLKSLKHDNAKMLKTCFCMLT